MGSSEAFVGASGSAKSTVIDLLPGVLEPADGTIAVDGVPPEGLLNAWRARVGERGLALSRGQRRGLGIARAPYSEPLVVVMDEATSALDTQRESCVTDANTSVCGGVTNIVVAHAVRIAYRSSSSSSVALRAPCGGHPLPAQRIALDDHVRRRTKRLHLCRKIAVSGLHRQPLGNHLRQRTQVVRSVMEIRERPQLE